MAEAAQAEAFVEALFRGAATIYACRPSPSWTLQIAQHARKFLLAAAGAQSELSLDVRGKELLAAGEALAASEEVAAVASALQLLGVRRVVLSSGLAPESLVKLMKLVVVESEVAAGTPPAELRKSAENSAIDGIQLLFSGKSEEPEE